MGGEEDWFSIKRPVYEPVSFLFIAGRTPHGISRRDYFSTGEGPGWRAWMLQAHSWPSSTRVDETINLKRATGLDPAV
jgi:hypothetical protein